ncbi:MAG: acylphosphatase [Pirellulaceae bacterium]
MTTDQPTSDEAHRFEVFYTGRVQGVGFRWTARHIAQGFAVTGFVRNLDDGRVQLVAEGAAGEVERFLTAISERMRDNIRHKTVSQEQATGQFSSFEIA